MLNQMLKTYLSVVVDVNPGIPVRCVAVTVYSHTPSYRQRAFQSEMQSRALPHVQRLGCAAAVGRTGHLQNPGDNGQKNWQSGHLQYNRKEGNVLFNDALNTFYVRLYGVRHMVKDQSICCRHMVYSFRLAARVLLYASSHRQDNTYHGLCYTSRGALAGTRNSSMGPPHEGSIRRPIAPLANALTMELHLAPHNTTVTRQKWRGDF